MQTENKKMNVAWWAILIVMFCGCEISEQERENQGNDSELNLEPRPTEIIKAEETIVNDSLNAVANIIAGIVDTSSIYKYVKASDDFKLFSKSFSRRWETFDSIRLTQLRFFKQNELSKIVHPQSTLFYPFSGPDILYAQTFFPEADRYVMIGLEPVGSIPNFEGSNLEFFSPYFNGITKSLRAILNFSFFRTASMSSELRNKEVDGALHLLLLFLKRGGNQLCSANPITVDSLGNLVFLDSFSNLKLLSAPTKGVEIKFITPNKQNKVLYYFSLNAEDEKLKSNIGFTSFLKKMGVVNTYLKGASYLLHRNSFSLIRNIILDQSEQVIQDDSGVPFKWFLKEDTKWGASFFGQYHRPISMFAHYYQKDLDSLFKTQGSRIIGFGIGYNFTDKNSNFMVISKKK